MGGRRRRYVGSVLRGRASKAEASDSGYRRLCAGMRVRDARRRGGGKMEGGVGRRCE